MCRGKNRKHIFTGLSICSVFRDYVTYSMTRVLQNRQKNDFKLNQNHLPKNNFKSNQNRVLKNDFKSNQNQNQNPFYFIFNFCEKIFMKSKSAPLQHPHSIINS